MLFRSQRQAIEAMKKQRQEQLDALEQQRNEEFEALKKKQEEEDMEVLLSSFKKDRQGAVTSIAELKLPPMLGNLAEPAVSTSLFSGDQLAAINHYATESSRQAYDAMIEYIKASKNTPHEYTGNVGSTTTTENPSPMLPISSVMPQNMPMNPYYSQDGRANLP